MFNIRFMILPICKCNCSLILGNYHSIGEALSSEGVLAFGHDHVGHGRSEGIQAYIDSVDQYVDDMIDHCTVSRPHFKKVFLIFA